MANATRRFLREAKIWSAFDHINILPFIGILEKDKEMFLVSLWMERGDLSRVLRSWLSYMEEKDGLRASHHDHAFYSTLSEGRLIHEIASGVSYLHLQNCVHGDIKASNVLLTANGRVLLCDFGLTKVLTCAPPFPSLSDIAVIFAVAGGERPAFEPQSRLGVDFQSLWELAARCWKTQPRERPTMPEVMELLKSSVGRQQGQTRSTLPQHPFHIPPFKGHIHSQPSLSNAHAGRAAFTSEIGMYILEDTEAEVAWNEKCWKKLHNYSISMPEPSRPKISYTESAQGSLDHPIWITTITVGKLTTNEDLLLGLISLMDSGKPLFTQRNSPGTTPPPTASENTSPEPYSPARPASPGLANLPDNETQVAHPAPSTTPRPETLSHISKSLTLCDINTIRIERPIGGGGNCDIFLGVHLHSKVKLSMKRPRLFANEDEVANANRRFLREAKIWSTFSHPNILPFIGIFQKNSEIYLVSLWMERGDLSRVLTERLRCTAEDNSSQPGQLDHAFYRTLSEEKLIREIASGILYLHNRNCIHGDIKSANVLLAEDGRALLCDFGLTKVLDRGWAATSTAMKGAGSRRWQSPELFLNGPKTPESDVYAFGMTITEILTCTCPFPALSDTAVMFAVYNGERPTFTPGSRLGTDFQPFWKLAARCWQIQPKHRPPMAEVIEILSALSPSKSIKMLSPKMSLPAPRVPASGASPSLGTRSPPSGWQSSLSTPSPVVSSVDEEELLGDEELMQYIKRQQDRKIASGATNEALEEMLKFPGTAPPVPPCSPQTMLRSSQSAYLSDYERNEILDYPAVYYIGARSEKKPATRENTTNNHGYDDERGDYLVVNHDHLAYRYEVINALGKGSFGQVLHCQDHLSGQSVAIKLVRNEKRFHHQALVEIKILDNMRKWDPDEKYHVIKMTEHFYFRSHLCIAMELLSISLHELIKANGFVGFTTTLIRRVTSQMLASLVFLRRHRIVHCDLKPENILLRHPAKSAIKIIDFGSSCFEHEKVYTYIQSRFYRSPEVILGMNYHMAIDMWSLGCTLAELLIGYPIFPGENEQEQLSCIMEVLGVPDKDLVNRSSRKKLFFDSTGAPRPVVNSKGRRRRPGSKTLEKVLRCNDEHFIDFIAKCLVWDPERRMKPSAALRHPFVASGRRPKIIENIGAAEKNSADTAVPWTKMEKPKPYSGEWLMVTNPDSPA